MQVQVTKLLPNINILSVFILTLSYILATVPISYAETNSTGTSRINAEAGVYVEQNKPYENFEGTFHNYAGYTGINGSIVSYLRFDITPIPKSNLMHDIVIDSAKLRLLIQSVNGTTDTAFVIEAIVLIMLGPPLILHGRNASALPLVVSKV